MSRRIPVLLALVLAVVAVGCRTPMADTVTQVCTIDALLAGAYDGTVSCRALLRHGDFGIGTFHRLDGEMVVFQGRVYQVPHTGVVREVGGAPTTPFASVCPFAPTVEFALGEGLDYAAVQQMIDARMANPNGVFACHIRGTFTRMKTRSVPPQSKPYPPLAEVTRTQPVFEMEQVAGDIVGFYLPPFVKGINVPGYHFHFLSADRTRGGHILDFEIAEGTVAVDSLSKLYLLLEGLPAEVDLSKDRSQELHRVEVDAGAK